MRISPLAVDLLIALALTVVAVLLAQEAPGQGWPELDAYGCALAVLANLPVVLRNRAPVIVCLAVILVSAVYVSSGYWPVVTTFGPMLAVYTVASLHTVRVSVACAALLGALWIHAGVVSESDSMPSVIGQALVFPAVLCRFGLTARRAAELTRRLRREQAERADREVAEERARIARELHDVVAHHMSVISVQAGLAGFVFDSDRRTARAALGTIADTSTEGLEELRRVLRVLREDEPAEPMPGLDRLGELVGRIRAGGVRVELHTEGTPRTLAPGVELCAYRVVQEALTNILKHAPRASATVTLAYHPQYVTVSVLDDGEGVNPDRVGKQGGHGLIGMRERAKLYGGTIRIGPRSEGGGGYAVRLTLPAPGRAARQGDDAPG